jgi:hypothetical protein
LSFLVIIILETEVAQPLVTVQVNTFAPTAKLLAVACGSVNEESVAPPMTVQEPVSPAAALGVLAFKLKVAPQIVWLVPATDKLTAPRLVTVTSEKLPAEGQTPFVTVHLNTLAPKPKPVTWVEGLFGLMIEPLPLCKVQIPVPAVGTTALSTALPVGSQVIAFAPALAVEGGVKLLITKSALVEAQFPFEIVHLNLLTPGVKPLTVELN